MPKKTEKKAKSVVKPKAAKKTTSKKPKTHEEKVSEKISVKEKVNVEVTMEKLVNLAKRRGFVFKASEIYGGIAGFWDWGPYGVELKNNIKNEWWRSVVYDEEAVVGLDSAIIQNPKVWQASGHVAEFHDPMVDCRSCKRRFRADHIAGLDSKDIEKLNQSLQDKACPVCGNKVLNKVRNFHLMFKTQVGPIEDNSSTAYLRPETAGGIFTNFELVRETTRKRIPFGIAQIGKGFRNEISPGDFVFRLRELEMMELEFFVKPGSDEGWFKYWKEKRMKWYTELGISKENLRFRDHSEDEKAHYAKYSTDIEYNYPIGWKELEGVANRTDFDLSAQMKESKKDLSYYEPETEKKYVPYVIEPSVGVERAALAFIADAYHEEEVRGEPRTVLSLDRRLAPIKVAVLPLSKDEKLSPLARKVWEEIRSEFRSEYDEAQSIGRRYRRQDEIGTPYCVTVDFESLKDKSVTVRDRDTMKQDRVKIKELAEHLKKKFK